MTASLTKSIRAFLAAGAVIAALMLALAGQARAQSTIIVADCNVGTTYFAGNTGRPLLMNTTGQLCSAASVSASITGFAPASTGTPISVTTGGNTGTLPAGAVVVASNVGATNGAYCKLGASATTSDQLISPNSWFAFTVGASTQLTCITSSSTTTVNMVGGAGLPTGAGGGGGSGGSSGAVTIASTGVASGAYSAGSIAAGAGVDGWDLTQGAKADAAWSSGSGSVVAILKAIATNSGAAIPAGSALIGKLGIDQTTPGTTNGVALVGVNGATALAGNGATGTGSPRVTIASDNTPFPIKLDQTTPGTTNAVSLSQINSTTTAAGNGVVGAGVQRVAIASDNTAFSVNATLGAETTKVIGTVRNLGNVGGVLDAVIGAAAPANSMAMAALGGGATGGFLARMITCDNHVFKHITSATDTLLVQGVASQTIYVCGWRSRAAGVATWFLENTASANANCSSSLTQITGVATEAANTGETLLPPYWTGLKNTAGNGLCANSTGTGGVDLDVWYTQF